MEIKIIKEKITLDELKKLAQKSFGDMIKAVVDIKEEVIALGGELHADANAVLLKQEHEQKNLWGINIYPDKPRDEWIEFNSLINIRPLLNNRSIEIQNPEIKQRIKEIINKLIY